MIGDLPIGTPVAFEAASGWGWLVELLDDYGFEPHLVHPSKCKAIASARLKNDKVDAHILAQLLRADLLPEAWIAPPAVRQVRARCGTGSSWSGCARCWSGPGQDWLAGLDLPVASREVIADCLALIDALQVPIDRLDVEVREQAKADPRVKVLTRLPGVGEFTALVILAEIGDIDRFGSARTLAAWAGLTPTVRGSDLVIRQFAGTYQAIARRRGKKIATTAVARKLLTRAYHLLTEPSTDAGTAAEKTCTPRRTRAGNPDREDHHTRASSQNRMSRPSRAR